MAGRHVVCRLFILFNLVRTDLVNAESLYKCKGGVEIYRNEKGVVYPIVLLVTMVAFFVLVEATIIYVSEFGFVTEIKDYYKKETKKLLDHIEMPEDDAEPLLDYNRNYNQDVDIYK